MPRMKRRTGGGPAAAGRRATDAEASFGAMSRITLVDKDGHHVRLITGRGGAFPTTQPLKWLRLNQVKSIKNFRISWRVISCPKNANSLLYTTILIFSLSFFNNNTNLNLDEDGLQAHTHPAVTCRRTAAQTVETTHPAVT